MSPATLKKFYVQVVILAGVIGAAALISWTVPILFAVDFDRSIENKPISENTAAVQPSLPEKPEIVPTHIKTPDAVKAIYMSQCVVGTRSFREKLVALADTTEINSLVIDIKDYSGKLAFRSENPKISHALSDACRADDMLEFIDYVHKKGIYVIGRITVFQDPYMTKLKPHLAVRKLSDGGVWKDYKGLSFIDVGAKEHWDYIAEISKEAHAIGFDELNFDYIRFPSDGNMKDTHYTLSIGKSKQVALEEFFKYLNEQLKPTGAVLSADLFGMTTTNTDDLNIGQVLERTFPHFDFIAPMVYPSHYPPNFNGWANPNHHPYELIKFVMDSAVTRAKAFDTLMASTTPGYNADSVKKLRPWLQDFDYGGTYDIAEVKAQIKATYDSGLNSWMLWAPSNIYTLGALDKQ